MTGIGLIFLILALMAIFGGIYFAVWCFCAVRRNHQGGHYIIEGVDEELQHKKINIQSEEEADSLLTLSSFLGQDSSCRFSRWPVKLSENISQITPIDLICLILALLGIFGGICFAVWCRGTTERVTVPLKRLMVNCATKMYTLNLCSILFVISV